MMNGYQTDEIVRLTADGTLELVRDSVSDGWGELPLSLRVSEGRPVQFYSVVAKAAGAGRDEVICRGIVRRGIIHPDAGGSGMDVEVKNWGEVNHVVQMYYSGPGGSPPMQFVGTSNGREVSVSCGRAPSFEGEVCVVVNGHHISLWGVKDKPSTTEVMELLADGDLTGVVALVAAATRNHRRQKLAAERARLARLARTGGRFEVGEETWLECGCWERIPSGEVLVPREGTLQFVEIPVAIAHGVAELGMSLWRVDGSGPDRHARPAYSTDFEAGEIEAWQGGWITSREVWEVFERQPIEKVLDRLCTPQWNAEAAVRGMQYAQRRTADCSEELRLRRMAQEARMAPEKAPLGWWWVPLEALDAITGMDCWEAYFDLSKDATDGCLAWWWRADGAAPCDPRAVTYYPSSRDCFVQGANPRWDLIPPHLYGAIWVPKGWAESVLAAWEKGVVEIRQEWHCHIEPDDECPEGTINCSFHGDGFVAAVGYDANGNRVVAEE